MRKFNDPSSLFKNLTDPARIFLKDDKKPAASPVSSAANDKATEDAKAAEAASAARRAAAGNSGTSLSPLQNVQSLGTKRRTLGSAY